MESVRMMDTVAVYLKVSRAEMIPHGRAVFLQTVQKYGHQQCANLHYFRTPLTITMRKHPNTFQPSRSFNSSADYARLGLPPKASRAEIKSAYFSLAKKLHPDNGGDAGHFNEVTEAYKRLMHDTQYVDGANGDNRHKDPQWDEEMERKMRARMWMEQRMMEEQMRRRRQRVEFDYEFREAHRNNPERDEAMKLFFRTFILRMLGAYIFLELFFSAMIPSGCCKKCMSQENYMKRF